MQKRILSIILCGLLLLTSIGCWDTPESSEAETSATTSHAPASTTTTASTTSVTTTMQSTAAPIEIVVEETTETHDITAEFTEQDVPAEEEPVTDEIYAGLYRLDTMECLYEQGDKVPIYPASLTKVLTACTALRYASPDTVYTVGTELNLVQPHSSLCMIQQGHQLTLRDLLTGMLMSSGNDAAYTIAVNIAREVTGNPDMSDNDAAAFFVGLMNDYASELGAVNSHFMNPEGWDNPEQRTTVYDLALISAHAMQIDEIREIAGTPSKYVVFASGEIVTWYNTNALLHSEQEYYLPQAVGLKTGSTDCAGKCLIAVVDIDGIEYIAVSANCQTNEERYETVLEMIEMI